MAISVVDPLTPAIERTRRMLFQPFHAGKWFALGFCSWLAQMGEQGGSNPGSLAQFPMGNGPRPQPPAPGGPLPGPGGFPQPMPGGAPPFPAPRAPQPGGLPPEFQQAREWALANLPLLIGIVAALILVGVALGLLLTWLKARGTFMFLDGVARDRARVGESWREYRREGNSLFRAWFALGLVSFAAFLVIAGLGAVLALPDIRAGRFGPGAGAAVLIGVPTVLLLSVGMLFIQMALVDFVAPIMYLRRTTAMAAWREFRTQLLAGRMGKFALYALFKLVINFVTGLIGIVLFCGTCCLAVLPYLGAVIMLPLSVFHRSYSLYYLEQFGPEWRVIDSEVKTPPKLDDLEFA